MAREPEHTAGPEGNLRISSTCTNFNDYLLLFPEHALINNHEHRLGLMSKHALRSLPWGKS